MNKRTNDNRLAAHRVHDRVSALRQSGTNDEHLRTTLTETEGCGREAVMHAMYVQSDFRISGYKSKG